MGYKVKPNIKHKMAFKKVLNGMSITKAMKEVNYSDKTSKNTGKLTRTKGWNMLLEKYLPELDLVKVHKEGLKATRKQITKQGIVNEPDYAVRHKYLETGYKLQGKLNNTNDVTNTQNNFFLNGEQLKRIAKRVDSVDNE